MAGCVYGPGAKYARLSINLVVFYLTDLNSLALGNPGGGRCYPYLPKAYFVPL